MNSNNNLKEENGYEISLADIVSFIQDSWKQLLLSGLVGATLGFGGWVFFGTYKTEITLVNNINNTNTNTNTFGLDLVLWRSLQENLPDLANQIINNDKLVQDQQEIYKAMKDTQWWSNNIILSFTISKTYAKELAAISKDLNNSMSTIQSFTIIAEGQSQNSSQNNAHVASKFFLSGGAYLQIKSLINSYKGDLLLSSSNIQKQPTQAQVDRIYLKERIKYLEELLKRFPNITILSIQTQDSSGYLSKFLSVESQLIAANYDLNQSIETINRLNGQLIEMKKIAKFIALASPLIEKEFNGFVLIKALLAIEQDLRNELKPSDLNGYLVLDQLRFNLKNIEMRFTNGLQANKPTNSKKAGRLKSIAGGAAIAGFLMLAFLMRRKILKSEI